MLSVPANSSLEQVQRLREQLGRLQTHLASAEDAPCILGEPWDRLLPAGALRPGVLLEWLADGEGAGAATLALHLARQACRSRWLAVVDEGGEFYPPAAAAQGIDLQRMLLLRPPRGPLADWALDQCLRASGVGAVLAWPQRLDGRAFRRLQLAAAAGGSLGLLVRPAAARREPSWAHARCWVEPRASPPGPCRGRRLRVELLRVKNGEAGGFLEVELDDETGALRPIAELARAAVAQRPAGA